MDKNAIRVMYKGAGFDLDTLLTTGVYFVETPANSPQGESGFLMSFQRGRSIFHVFYQLNTSTAFVRAFNAEAWSAWTEMGAGGGGGGGTTNGVLSGARNPLVGDGVAQDFWINTATWTIFGPKTTVWPAGVSLIGAPGTNGTNGTNGSNGVDGKTILYGTGAPDVGVGVDGDSYIDTSAHVIYGPKAGGAWPSGTSLIGPPGSNGTNGTNGTSAVILTGTGAPGAGVGANGDVYFDTAGLTLYGPKAGGSWPGSGFASVLNTSTIDQPWTGGVVPTPHDYGSPSAASTVTSNPGTGPIAKLLNNAAFTFQAPTHEGVQDVMFTNGATAGAVTFSGFTKVIAGDAMTTTVDHAFLVSYGKINGVSFYQIVAMQ